MFKLGAEVFSLPLEEKLQYEQGDSGRSFGFEILLFPMAQDLTEA